MTLSSLIFLTLAVICAAVCVDQVDSDRATSTVSGVAAIGLIVIALLVL